MYTKHFDLSILELIALELYTGHLTFGIHNLSLFVQMFAVVMHLIGKWWPSCQARRAYLLVSLIEVNFTLSHGHVTAKREKKDFFLKYYMKRQLQNMIFFFLFVGKIFFRCTVVFAVDQRLLLVPLLPVKFYS